MLAAVSFASTGQLLSLPEYAAKHQLDLPQPTNSEYALRLRIFKENTKVVEELNRAHNGSAEFSLEDSPFSMLTFEEFAALRLPRMGPSVQRATVEDANSASLAEPPAAFDWRTSGTFSAVTSVKDQGAMGSCWAFSAAENVEGQRAVRSKGAQMDDISVEQLIECDATHGTRSVDKTEYSDCGVFGGWPYLAYQYWMKAGGVRTAAQMPYCSGIPYGKPGYCIPCMVEGYSKSLCGDHSDLYCNTSTTLGQGPRGLCGSSKGTVAQLKDWRRIANDATSIASELVATGPLSIALDATLAFQFYKKGVLDPSGLIGGCGKSSELNHAVLLVGFGTDGSKPYWTIKNSWGAKWGEEGFFRFKRGEDKCGVESEVTTAVLA